MYNTPTHSRMTLRSFLDSPFIEHVKLVASALVVVAATIFLAWIMFS